MRQLFDFIMCVLLTPTVPFHAYLLWRMLRPMGVSYQKCLAESWLELWSDEEE